VTVSLALEEQSSDVSTTVGLYVHNTQALLEREFSVYSWHNITEVVPVVAFWFIPCSQSAAWVLRFRKITDVSLFSV
jgi:hypothetical protein